MSKDNQKKYKSKQKKSSQEIIKRIYNRFFDIYSARNQLGVSQEWDKWEAQSLPGNQNKNDRKPTKESGNIDDASHVKSPMTWAAIQTVVATVTDQETQIDLLARTKEDNHKTAVLGDVFDFAWEKSNGDVERFFLILDACRYGTAIWKEYFRTDTREIKDVKHWNPNTEELEWESREIEEYNDVYGKSIDLRTFYVDQMATNMENARDCFERVIMSYEQFCEQYPTRKYKNAKDVIAGSYFLGLFDDDRTGEIFAELQEDQVEVMEYWNKVRDERHIVANGVLLTPEVSPIPYKHKQLPYARLVFFAKDKQHFYGIGIPEVLEHHQASRDTLWNIMLDRMKLSLNRPLFVSPGTNLTDNDLVIYPGKVVEVPEPNSTVKEMDIQPPDSQSFNTIASLDSEAKLLIGADDPMTGVKSGGTATENAIAKEASLRRMKTFVKMLEGETMMRIGRLRLANIQQLYSVPVKIKKIVGRTRLGQLTSGFSQRVQDMIPGKKTKVEYEPIYRQFPIEKKKIRDEVKGEQWIEREGQYIELKPDDYMGDFDIRIKPSSTLPISKETLRMQWSEMMQGLNQMPALQQMLDWRKLAIDYLWKWDIDGSEYLVDPQTETEKFMELAIEENDRMMEGEPVPFTRGATPEHTARHRALIFSRDFLDYDTAIQNIIIRHYGGELLEQQVADAEKLLEEIREMQKTGQPPAPEQPEGQGGEQPPMNGMGGVPVDPNTGLPMGAEGEGMPQGGEMPPQGGDMGQLPPEMNEDMGMQPPNPSLQETTGIEPPQQQ